MRRAMALMTAMLIVGLGGCGTGTVSTPSVVPVEMTGPIRISGGGGITGASFGSLTVNPDGMAVCELPPGPTAPSSDTSPASSTVSFTLDSDTLARLKTVFAVSNFPALASQYGTPMADGYSVSITYEGKHVTICEPEMVGIPASLQNLVDTLRAIWQDAKSRAPTPTPMASEG